MKSNNTIFLMLLLFSFFHFHCIDSDKETKKTEWEIKYDSTKNANIEKEKLNSLEKERKRMMVYEFSKRYNAHSRLDSNDMRYSVDCVNLKFEKGNPLLIKNASILDIIKKDDSYNILVSFSIKKHYHDNPLFIVTLKCTNEQSASLYNFHEWNGHETKEIAFIITLDKLQKINLKISSEIEEKQSEDEFSYLLIENLNAFKGKGELIDYLEY